jgi:hypothetical protein
MNMCELEHDGSVENQLLFEPWQHVSSSKCM